MRQKVFLGAQMTLQAKQARAAELAVEVKTGAEGSVVGVRLRR